MLASIFDKKAFEILLPIAFLGIVFALKNVADIEDDDFYSEVRSIGFFENMASKLPSSTRSEILSRSLRSHTTMFS